MNHKIESFLRTGKGDFESLSLELFRYQVELNKPYQAYCLAQEITPAAIGHWWEIPAVPIEAFKSAVLASFPVGQAAAVFQSSGTTRQVPSRHYLKTLSYYESSVKTSFSRWVLPDKASLPFLILTPAPAEAPNSSLSWMMDVVKRAWGGPGSDYYVQRGRLDEPRLAQSLEKGEATQQPVALLGTTIAFLAFFDYCHAQGVRWELPLGSRVMDTGGMKTQKRDMARPEFVRQVGKILGIPQSQCVNEYGMCELGSQFYDRGESSYLQGPPWTRTLVIDPHTGEPAPARKSGLLRHFDLANVDSVLAVQTEDVGIAEGQGFIFQGRDPGAEPKGCSLSAEAFLT